MNVSYNLKKQIIYLRNNISRNGIQIENEYMLFYLITKNKLLSYETFMHRRTQRSMKITRMFHMTLNKQIILI